MMEGGCFCGAVRYRIEGEFDVTHCHCLHCRKLSGAPFLTWVEAKSADVQWLCGSPTRFAVRAGVTRSFCAGCGSPLTYENQEHSDSVDITAGTLDDPSGLKPGEHLWFDRHLSWARIDDELPRFARGRRD